MDCIILCGGLGKRLEPFEGNQDTPKALIKIKGKTLLERQIEHLKKYDIKRFVLATGIMSDKIASFIGPRYDFIISKENEPLGTAGAVKKALEHVGNDFFVINVDDLTDINFDKLRRFNEPTIALGQYRCQFGVVKTSGNDVIAFDEKPILPTVWVSCGTYYLNKTIELPDKGSLEKDVFPNINLKAYKHTGHWQTINTKKDIEEAEKSEWIK